MSKKDLALLGLGAATLGLFVALVREEKAIDRVRKTFKK